MQELESSLKGLMELRDTLTIRASISGKVVDVTRNLHPGRWINEELRLGAIISPQSAELSGIIQANDYSRIELNQNAVFLPNEAEIDKVNATISEIEDTNVDNISDLYLTSLYGGDVAVRKGRDGKLIPEEASYRVKFHVNADNYPVNKVIVGHVFISAKQQSLIVYIYDNVISVLIRESGF